MVAKKPASRLDHLRALDKIVDERLRDASPATSAPLVKQKRELLREIDELEKLVPKGSIVDDLASRRKSRHAAPKGDRAAGKDGGVVGSGGG